MFLLFSFKNTFLLLPLCFVVSFYLFFLTFSSSSFSFWLNFWCRQQPQQYNDVRKCECDCMRTISNLGWLRMTTCIYGKYTAIYHNVTDISYNVFSRNIHKLILKKCPKIYICCLLTAASQTRQWATIEREAKSYLFDSIYSMCI